MRRVRHLSVVALLVGLAAVARAGSSPAPQGGGFSMDQIGASQDHSVDALWNRKLQEFARRSLLRLERIAAGMNAPQPGHGQCIPGAFCDVPPDSGAIFSNPPPLPPSAGIDVIFGLLSPGASAQSRASSQAQGRSLLPEPVTGGLVAMSVALLVRARRRDR